jgi:hypothetical protein
MKKVLVFICFSLIAQLSFAQKTMDGSNQFEVAEGKNTVLRQLHAEVNLTTNNEQYIMTKWGDEPGERQFILMVKDKKATIVVQGAKTKMVTIQSKSEFKPNTWVTLTASFNPKTSMVKFCETVGGVENCVEQRAYGPMNTGSASLLVGNMTGQINRLKASNGATVYFDLNYKSSNLTQMSTTDFVQLDYIRTENKRIAQAFLADKSGTLNDITIRLKGGKGNAQGGKMSIDLVEIQNDLSFKYIATSEYKGYFYNDLPSGALNTFRFGAGVEIKEKMAYVFVVRSNNFFRIVGANNTIVYFNGPRGKQTTRSCFSINAPYNKIDEPFDTKVLDLAKPIPNEFNIFYSINLKNAEGLPINAIHEVVDVVNSKMFDAQWYSENNPDIVKAGFTGVEGAKKHFLQYGCKEGRQSGPLFNVQFYKNKYSDLSKLWGDDYLSYYKHYMEFGRTEGRQAVK